MRSVAVGRTDEAAAAHRGRPTRIGVLGSLAVALGAAAFDGCGPGLDIVAVHREVCDGVDNDQNGVIDDLDANVDGLCDCLRIGVFGYPGPRPREQLQGMMSTRAVTTAILAGQTMTADLLSTLDVVIVQDVQDGQATGTDGQEGIGKGIGRVYSDAEVEALQAWVAAGGGVMTLAGYNSITEEVTNVNRLLAPFGVSYDSQVVLLSGSFTASVPVTHWDRTHPLASGVTKVGVAGGRSVLGAGTLVAWEPNPGASDVARAMEWGRGHVFVWGDEWITYDSNWSNAEYQDKRLWLNSFKWLSAAGYCHVPIP